MTKEIKIETKMKYYYFILIRMAEIKNYEFLSTAGMCENGKFQVLTIEI